MPQTKHWLFSQSLNTHDIDNCMTINHAILTMAHSFFLAWWPGVFFVFYCSSSCSPHGFCDLCSLHVFFFAFGFGVYPQISLSWPSPVTITITIYGWHWLERDMESSSVEIDLFQRSLLTAMNAVDSDIQPWKKCINCDFRAEKNKDWQRISGKPVLLSSRENMLMLL